MLSELALNIGDALGRPATVKCRIGVNNEDSYENLYNFIEYVSKKGHVQHFIVHARKAVLGAKFTPDMNRKIPPLKYDYVYRLLKDFPNLKFTINGGINTMEDVQCHLQQGVHGVMIGRAIVNNPFYWNDIDSALYGVKNPGKYIINRIIYLVCTVILYQTYLSVRYKVYSDLIDPTIVYV